MSAGHIELRESLAGEAAYVRTTVIRSAAATLATIALCSMLIVVIGWVLLGRPMQPIMDMVHRIAGGDLDHRLESSAGEIGVLALELNKMCEQLVLARAKIES